MKSINQYISEKLIVNKYTRVKHNYFPETKEELQELIKHLIEERGNNADFNDIDTSKITDMSYLFYELNDFKKDFNGDISKWDVSNVINMRSMFNECESFNQPLDNWNVSNVKYMHEMFDGCTNFKKTNYARVIK